MKSFRQLICLLFPVCLLLCVTCVSVAEEASAAIDYAGQIRLNMASETVKQEVTVKTFVDGDTTHFHVPACVDESGVLKARYLGVNTPESTGKIEEYGKKASGFTRDRLSRATSIVVESDTDHWVTDSTGERRLVWVWYKTDDMEDYRNLNVELLQEGLAIANSSAQNRYGDTCMAAIAQAKAQKLNVYSGEKDPDFFYGDAIELTLKELRLNAGEYVGKKVAFSGVIIANYNNGVFVEAYDAETERCYGLYVYYGFGLSGKGLDILAVGNEARIVGFMQYYEAGGAYQVSGLTYRMMKPDDPGNIQKLSEGHRPAYLTLDAGMFLSGSVPLTDGEGRTRAYPVSELAMNTSVRLEGLTVAAAYTGRDDAAGGEMTLVCTLGESRLNIRASRMWDENDQPIEPESYIGQVIDVCGIVDAFAGSCQVRVFSPGAITPHP